MSDNPFNHPRLRRSFMGLEGSDDENELQHPSQSRHSQTSNLSVQPEPSKSVYASGATQSAISPGEIYPGRSSFFSESAGTEGGIEDSRGYFSDAHAPVPLERISEDNPFRDPQPHLDRDSYGHGSDSAQNGVVYDSDEDISQNTRHGDQRIREWQARREDFAEQPPEDYHPEFVDIDLEAGNRPSLMERAKSFASDLMNDPSLGNEMDSEEFDAPQEFRAGRNLDRPYASSNTDMYLPKPNMGVQQTRRQVEPIHAKEFLQMRHIGPLHRQNRKGYREMKTKPQFMIRNHVQDSDHYVQFVYQFAEALLTFDIASHRIEAQLKALARVMGLEARFYLTVNTIQIQIEYTNPDHDHKTRLIQPTFNRLHISGYSQVYEVYARVLHDKMFASEGRKKIFEILEEKASHSPRFSIPISGIQSFLICGIAFSGAVTDMLVAAVMGMAARVLLIGTSRTNLSSSGSEVVTAAVVSIVARALSVFVPHHLFCFSAISSSGVVSLLPGFIILQGALDNAYGNSSLGGPKVVAGIMTSLYLGFGTTLGSDLFLSFGGGNTASGGAASDPIKETVVHSGSFKLMNRNVSDLFVGSFTFKEMKAHRGTAAASFSGCHRSIHSPWYLRTLPLWAYFLLVPIFTIIAARNMHQNYYDRHFAVMVIICCVAFIGSRAAGIFLHLDGHPDYISALGALLVGLMGNLYARVCKGNAFTVMILGIMILVPDGLSVVGGLQSSSSADEYTQSLDLARKLLSVTIGILCGTYLSAAIVYIGFRKNVALITF